MKNEPIKHDQSYPPAVSAGPENAYYLRGCDAVQRGPSYASCLFKIAEYERGVEREIYRECHQAIAGRRCIALEMREQEKLQGVALYYFPRKSPQPLYLPFKVTGDFGVRITNLTDPALIPKDPKPLGRSAGVTTKPAPAAKSLDDHLTAATSSGFADALTAAVADAATEKPITGGSDAMKALVAEAVKSSPPVTVPPMVKPSRPPMQPGETPLQYARRLAAQTTNA